MGVLRNLSLQRPEDMLEGKDDALECEQIIRAMAAWLRLLTYKTSGVAVYSMSQGMKRFVPRTKDKSVVKKYTAELDYLYDDNFLGNVNKGLFMAIREYDDIKKQFVCEHEGKEVRIQLMLYKSELKNATSSMYGCDGGVDTRFFSYKQAFKEEFKFIREMFPLTMPIVEEASSHAELHSMQQAEAERVEAERVEAERVEAERKQAEAKRVEAERKQEEEAKRQQEEEAKRQQEEAQRKQEEEAQRQQEEAQRQEEEDKRKQEEAKCQQEEVKCQHEEAQCKQLRKRKYEELADWQQCKFGSAYVAHESAAQVNNKALREALAASKQQYEKDQQRLKKKKEKMTLAQWEERFKDEVAPKIEEDKKAKREAAEKKREAAEKKRKLRQEKWDRENEAAKRKAQKLDEQGKEKMTDSVELTQEAMMSIRLELASRNKLYAEDIPEFDDFAVAKMFEQALNRELLDACADFQKACDAMSLGNGVDFFDLFSKLGITTMAALFPLLKDWRKQKLRFLHDSQASVSQLIVDPDKLKRIVTVDVCEYMKLTSGKIIEVITVFVETHLEASFKAFSKINLNMDRRKACEGMSPGLVKRILKHGPSTYLMVFLYQTGILTTTDLDIFFEKGGEVKAAEVQEFADSCEVASCVDLEGEAFIDKFTEMLQAVKA